MEYQHKVTELVAMRSSWRTYEDVPLDGTIRDQLDEACAAQDRGLFGEALRIRLVDLRQTAPPGAKLGDYGTLKNVRYFLAGVIGDGPLAYESYGYRMEQLVLLATDLGLGTCWLGYFDKTLFPDQQPGEGEIFPAVSAVGWVASRRRLAERLIRTAVRAKKRKPREKLFFDGELGRPLSVEAAGAYERPLTGVRVAPSSGNTQPWRVVKEPGEPVFHFHLVQVKEGYQRRRLHDIDVGIAMCHFELVARRDRLDGEWRALDSPPCETPDKTDYVVSWFDSSAST